jgi:tRNA (cytidine/uridine-2'-O-)-methyltransferase
VGRTCVALDMELVLIHPLGFEISDKRVKRSGLDYWPHIRLVEFASWEAFLAKRAPRADQLFLFEEYATRSFYEPTYPEDAYLVFGRETKGIPGEIVDAHRGQLVGLPMRSDKVRSLNLANTVAAAAYQAVRAHLS